MPGKLHMLKQRYSIIGAINLCKILSTVNHTLRFVHVGSNFIGDEGIVAISTTLDNNRVSEKINVSDCKITEKGAKALAASLITNYTLKSLCMKKNDITVDGAIAVLGAAVANKICQEVEIDSEYNTDDIVKKFIAILKERKRQEVGSS